jgi:hypothetical protein
LTVALFRREKLKGTTGSRKEVRHANGAGSVVLVRAVSRTVPIHDRGRINPAVRWERGGCERERMPAAPVIRAAVRPFGKRNLSGFSCPYYIDFLSLVDYII